MSPWFSVMFDESDNIANKSCLSICVKYIDPDRIVQESLVRLIHLDGGKDGKSVSEVVIQSLIEMKLDFNRIVSWGTDGASAMVGAKIGAVTYLIKTTGYSIPIHCHGHRQALGNKDVVDVWLLDVIESILADICSYFSQSSKRCGSLLYIKELLLSVAGSISKLHAVRWLSRGNVVRKIVYNYLPLLLLFEAHRQDQSLTAAGRLKAKNLHQHLRNGSVLGFLLFLEDVISSRMNGLNAHFQNVKIAPGPSARLVETTLLRLMTDFCDQRCGARGSALEWFMLLCEEVFDTTASDGEEMLEVRICPANIPSRFTALKLAWSAPFSVWISEIDFRALKEAMLDYAEKLCIAMRARLANSPLLQSFDCFDPAFWRLHPNDVDASPLVDDMASRLLDHYASTKHYTVSSRRPKFNPSDRSGSAAVRQVMQPFVAEARVGGGAGGGQAEAEVEGEDGILQMDIMIDSELLASERDAFNCCMRAWQGDKQDDGEFSDLWKLYEIHGLELDRTCPEWFKLFSVSLVLALGTPTCERTFSTMNITHTPMRNRLQVETVWALMMIQLNGPSVPSLRINSSFLARVNERWHSFNSQRRFGSTTATNRLPDADQLASERESRKRVIAAVELPAPLFPPPQSMTSRFAIQEGDAILLAGEMAAALGEPIVKAKKGRKKRLPPAALDEAVAAEAPDDPATLDEVEEEGEQGSEEEDIQIVHFIANLTGEDIEKGWRVSTKSSMEDWGSKEGTVTGVIKGRRTISIDFEYIGVEGLTLVNLSQSRFF